MSRGTRRRPRSNLKRNQAAARAIALARLPLNYRARRPIIAEENVRAVEKRSAPLFAQKYCVIGREIYAQSSRPRSHHLPLRKAAATAHRARAMSVARGAARLNQVRRARILSWRRRPALKACCDTRAALENISIAPNRRRRQKFSSAAASQSRWRPEGVGMLVIEGALARMSRARRRRNRACRK